MNFRQITLAAFYSYMLSSFTVNGSENPENKPQDIKEIISVAIQKFENTKRENWTYQVSRYEDEEGDVTSSIEKHTSRNDKKGQWMLVQYNGKKPSKKQQNKFVRKKNKELENKKEGANHSMKLRELINHESLKYVSESESHVKASFDVYAKKLGRDSVGKLKGSLFYNKERKFIETITIKSIEKFSPLFATDIETIELKFEFVDIDDHILPRKQSMKMTGTFAYFTEINEVSSDEYSNYEYD